MERKLQKNIFRILICIIISLIILAINCNVKATFYYEGIEYYTKGDITLKSTGSGENRKTAYILVTGDNEHRYCIDHGLNLKKRTFTRSKI